MKPKQLCVCEQTHRANAQKADGTPVALWTCPSHGNVYDDRRVEITLSSLQRRVLEVVCEKRGTDADQISRILNVTIASASRAMAALRALNFIEPEGGRSR